MTEFDCRYSNCSRCFQTQPARNSHEGLAHDGISPNCPSEERLEELYEDNTLDEIAERIGATRPALIGWMDDLNIDRRPRDYHLVRKPPTITMDGKGYERIIVQESGSNASFRVHQLLAIAKGAPPAKVFSGEYSVHHKNGVPWDNRPDNIELMTRREHQKRHARAD